MWGVRVCGVCEDVRRRRVGGVRGVWVGGGGRGEGHGVKVTVLSITQISFCNVCCRGDVDDEYAGGADVEVVSMLVWGTRASSWWC